MAVKRRPPARRVARRINPKFYVFLGIVAAAVIAIVFFITNVNTAVVEQGEIMFEKALPVVVVRDEQVISAPSYGKPNYLAAEGERVEAGADVAEVYKGGYNDKVITELLEVQAKIEEYQENLLAGDEQLKSLNDQITQKSADMRQIVNGELEGDIVTAENELKALMAQKQAYLRDTATADATLNDFYSKESELQGRVNEWKEAVTAPEAGVVSFYFDGAETKINADNISTITSDDVSEILNGGAEENQNTATDDAAEKPLFRLVNNYQWFLVTQSDTEIPEFAQGNTFSIAFDDYLDKPYSGTVVGTVKEEDAYVYALEITDDIGQLLNARRTDVKVFSKFEGMKVPEKALQEKDGVTGVTVVAGRDKTFVPIEVKIIKDGSAIIAPVDANSILTVNQHVEV